MPPHSRSCKRSAKICARFQSLVPEDIKITYEFDQSAYVRSALMSVLREAIIGALADRTDAASFPARLAHLL